MTHYFRGECHDTKYRLVTRSDFDGLVCGALLKHLDLIDEILFVHPEDMQDSKIDITGSDITTNLPSVPGVHLAFDHHLSETLRNKEKADNTTLSPPMPLGGAGGLGTLRRTGTLSGTLDRNDGSGRQGRLGQLQPRGNPRSDRLGTVELPDGRPHRAGSLP